MAVKMNRIFVENGNIKAFKIKKLSFASICKISFKEAINEYVRNCSLAGVKQILDPTKSIFHRIFWFLIFCTMVGLSCYFLVYLWFGTLAKPLVVTMQSSTYHISNIDFPAIALCNSNRISKKAAKAYAKEIYPNLTAYKVTLEEVEWFVLQNGRLINFEYSEYLSRHRLMDYINGKTFQTYNVMKRLSPKCEDMLVRCAWAAKRVDCMSLFTVRRTIRGHCCIFNYVLEYNAGGRPTHTISTVKRQMYHGKMYGLNVIVDPLIDDYAFPIIDVNGFEVFIFDPKHYADPFGGRVGYRLVEPNKAVSYELMSIQQKAAWEVRKYSPATRQCLFHDEREAFGNMYSYSGCILNCGIRAVLSLCNCIPYFFPSSYSGPLCTLEHLRCLNKYREKIMFIYPINAYDLRGLEMELQDSLHCPECLPNCEFTQHYTKASKIPTSLPQPYQEKIFRGSFIHDLNLTNKCVISVYQSTEDGILNILDVVAYWFEILSNIGGYAGVLIGFSIISVIEFLYFILVRFATKCYWNYKEYRWYKDPVKFKKFIN